MKITLIIKKLVYLIFVWNIFLNKTYSTPPEINLLYEDEKIALDASLTEHIINKYSYLNNCPHFDTKLLKNKVERYNIFKAEKGKLIDLVTSDGIQNAGYFLERGANKALLIGQGFSSFKEVLIPFFKLFPDYDILITDYRWRDWHDSKKIPLAAINQSLTEYIHKAKNDVIAAVEFLRNYKKYDTILKQNS